MVGDLAFCTDHHTIYGAANTRNKYILGLSNSDNYAVMVFTIMIMNTIMIVDLFRYHD